MFGLEPFWVPYARVRHSVMTGEPAFDQVYGTSVYQYLSGHPDQASLFGARAACTISPTTRPRRCCG
jgi:hypothetical protein